MGHRFIVSPTRLSDRGVPGKSLPAKAFAFDAIQYSPLTVHRNGTLRSYKIIDLRPSGNQITERLIASVKNPRDGGSVQSVDH